MEGVKGKKKKREKTEPAVGWTDGQTDGQTSLPAALPAKGGKIRSDLLGLPRES